MMRNTNKNNNNYNNNRGERIKKMFKLMMEALIEGERTAFLGYEKYDTQNKKLKIKKWILPITKEIFNGRERSR